MLILYDCKTDRTMTLRELESKYTSLDPSGGNELIKDLRAAANDTLTDKVLLRAFMEKALGGFSEKGRAICALGERMSPKDREELTLYGRLTAALLLVLQNMRAAQALREYTLLFLQYASAAVRKYNYFTTALDVICYKITKLGIDWHNVQDISSLDLLSYKLIEGIRFDKSSSEILSFQGRGQVLCKDGQLSVCSSAALESGALAFSVCGDRVGVYTRNDRSEKLKSSDQFSASSLGAFADTFLKVQEESGRKGPEKKEYPDGGKVDIRILPYEEGSDDIKCEVADPDAELRGRILDEELVKGLWAGDLDLYYFRDYACIRGAVLYRGHDLHDFSIRDAYLSYAKARADQAAADRTCFRAEVYNVSPGSGRANWMTPLGFAGISLLDETPDVKVGDKLILQVKNVITRGGETYINLRRPVGDVGTMVDFPSDPSETLDGFLVSYKSIQEEREKARGGNSDKDEAAIRILSTILSATVSRCSSIDAYRHLLVAAFLSGAICDAEAVKRLRAEAFFLGQCLRFAQGDKLVPVRDGVLPVEKKRILGLLGSWDAPDEGALDKESLPEGEESVVGRLEKLLLGVRIAGEYQDELKADREAVRRRICTLLGVEDSYKAGGVSRSGKYGRVERHDVEFKSSYVFRNDGKGADIERQGRGEVFEAVCGFLNADGGVLYLGVNDDGNPILSKDMGLNADKQWLKENRERVNRDRFLKVGHSTLGEKIGDEGDLDVYVQFLDCEKEMYFKEEFWSNIRIEVTDDNDAIRITVSPAIHSLAYLYNDNTYTDGVAFVRDGGRTVRMSAVQKEQRLSNLKRISKEMGFVVTIQEAIDRRQKLIFRDYASSNSGEIKDRYVVPILLFYNHENVYCYDLDSKRYKQFRLHRIGSVELSDDREPYPLKAEKPKEADVFRWLNDGKNKIYHVKLRMDIGAVNNLMEEYSCAELLPKEEFYREKNNKWILDTHLYGLEAVRRFYMGLADKIEILDTEDSEELKRVITEYAAKNF